jgi:hypothetical protein
MNFFSFQIAKEKLIVLTVFLYFFYFDSLCFPSVRSADNHYEKALEKLGLFLHNIVKHKGPLLWLPAWYELVNFTVGY